MGWNRVRRPAPDDVSITDDQQRYIARLKERIDRVPEGTYGDEKYTMTRAEADRFIKTLLNKIEGKQKR